MEPVLRTQEPKKSKRVLWIVFGVVAVVLIAVAAYYFITKSTEPEKTTVNTPQATEQEVTVASKSEVTQNLSSLNEALKQASADQGVAKAALKDANTPVKVTE